VAERGRRRRSGAAGRERGGGGGGVVPLVGRGEGMGRGATGRGGAERKEELAVGGRCDSG
jgi:hypothetical protein